MPLLIRPGRLWPRNPRANSNAESSSANEPNAEAPSANQSSSEGSNANADVEIRSPMHPATSADDPAQPVANPVVVVPDDEEAPMPGSFPESAPDDSTDENSENSEHMYQPSALDVLVTKVMLRNAFELPIEIVDSIFDFADYWPHTSTAVNFDDGHPALVGYGPPRENRFMLRTPPLGFVKPPHPDPEKYKTEPAKLLLLSDEHPQEQFQKWIGSRDAIVQHPARKIVFTITSRDQGWGGDGESRGTYTHSWTWFEAGLERVDAQGDCGDHCPEVQQQQPSSSSNKPHISPCAMRSVIPEVVRESGRARMEHPLLPSASTKIQCNKVAVREKATHTVEWRWDDDIEDDPESTVAHEMLEAKGRGRATGNGEFVRSLKLGDVVTVWAKARFPGWTNHVYGVKVDVYWTI